LRILRFGFAVVKRGFGIHTEVAEEEHRGHREEGWESIADATVNCWVAWLPWSLKAAVGDRDGLWAGRS